MKILSFMGLALVMSALISQSAFGGLGDDGSLVESFIQPQIQMNSDLQPTAGIGHNIDQCSQEYQLALQRCQSVCNAHVGSMSDAVAPCPAAGVTCADEAARMQNICARNMLQSGASRNTRTTSESSTGIDLGEIPQAPERRRTATTGGGGANRTQQGNGGVQHPVEPEAQTTQSESTIDPEFSMQTLESEVTSCTDQGNQAVKCCTSPVRCGVSTGESAYMPPPSNDPAGMRMYCEQLKYASNQGRSANSAAAGVCYSNHHSCSTTCSDSERKWRAQLSNCRPPHCDSGKVQNALNTFAAKTKSCQGLRQLERALAAQSSSNYQDARVAQQCAQQAAQDQAAQMAAIQDRQQDKGNLSDAGVDCVRFPNSPSCYRQQASTSFSGETDSFNINTGNGFSTDNFNTGGGGEGLEQPPQFASTDPQAAQGRAVPNGGAGGIPGSDALGNVAGVSPSAGVTAAGSKADILDGTTTGGGPSSKPAASPQRADGSGFGGFGGTGTEEFKSRYHGLDLKQYLPGGTKDPKRKIASGTGHPEIISKGENMFKRISDRISLMCKLKQLLGCE